MVAKTSQSIVLDCDELSCAAEILHPAHDEPRVPDLHRLAPRRLSSCLSHFPAIVVIVVSYPKFSVSL